MSFPLVSIIVPTYNAEEFIVENLNSILEQDYPNIEIVIADDCSTDNTQKVIRDYFKDKDTSKIKIFFNEKNVGVTKNSNICLKACTGKYVFLHAGDDVLLPGKISSQVEFLETHPEYVMCYHNVDVFDSVTNKTLYLYNSFYRNRTHQGDATCLLKYGAFFVGCSLAIRSEALPKEGYNEKILTCSDWFLVFDSLAPGGKIGYIDKVLSRYRRHPNSLSQRSDNNMVCFLDDGMIFFKELLYKYPHYMQYSHHFLAAVIFSFRYYGGEKNYLGYLLLSLKIKFNVKSFICLMLNLASFGRLKK